MQTSTSSTDQPEPAVAAAAGDSSVSPSSSSAATAHPELQYLELVRNIIASGEDRPDRTGTGTRSLFVPATMRFSLADDVFPLLTTKRVFFRGVAKELLWFLRADTSSLSLANDDVHIWDANGSRKFLDDRGFPERPVGDLGPVYGFQWRHFGAPYRGVGADYRCQGVDQIAEIVRQVRDDPYSRRIILCAWNPQMNPEMALPPCHVLAQFYVSAVTRALSCVLYQRSGDVGLGVPFNIASYALLTRMIAHVTGRPAGEFVHVIADAHVYKDHIEALKIQLKREPRAFPKLSFARPITSIDDLKYEDFIITGYSPHGKIEMKMSV